MPRYELTPETTAAAWAPTSFLLTPKGLDMISSTVETASTDTLFPLIVTVTLSAGTPLAAATSRDLRTASSSRV